MNLYSPPYPTSYNTVCTTHYVHEGLCTTHYVHEGLCTTHYVHEGCQLGDWHCSVELEVTSEHRNYQLLLYLRHIYSCLVIGGLLLE